MRWTIRFLILLACLATTVGTSAAANSSREDDPTFRSDRDRAIEIALDDREVQDRLALRPGLVAQAEPEAGTNVEVPGGGAGWLVRWSEPGDEDSPILTAVVSLEEGVLKASGLGLVVMPGRADIVDDWFGSAWSWRVLTIGFLACMLGAFRRGDGMRMLVPLAVLSIALIATLENVVSSAWVREGHIALFAIAIVALVLGAALWIRQANRPAPRFEPRWSPFVWAGVWVSGLVVQVQGVLRVSVPTDVSVASFIGAQLMKGGVPVYGNMIDLPGIVMHGDTYGPIAYLVYVPAVAMTDDGTAAVLWTNLAMSVLVGLVLFVLGARGGSLRRGFWAAAAWTMCPVAAVGVIAGNNDIVVALAVLALLLVLTRPAWRGALLAVAASTKFLPALLVLPLLRLRGETRRDTLRYLAGGVVALVVIFAIALRGIDALDEFFERTIGYQSERLGIRSLWGLAGIESLRHLCTLAALLLAIWHAVRWPRLVPHVAACSIAAILALLVAGLPQYWGTYATWLVPPVLVAMLWRGPVDAAAETR